MRSLVSKPSRLSTCMISALWSAKRVATRAALWRASPQQNNGDIRTNPAAFRLRILAVGAAPTPGDERRSREPPCGSRDEGGSTLTLLTFACSHYASRHEAKHLHRPIRK